MEFEGCICKRYTTITLEEAKLVYKNRVKNVLWKSDKPFNAENLIAKTNMEIFNFKTGHTLVKSDKSNKNITSSSSDQNCFWMKYLKLLGM